MYIISYAFKIFKHNCSTEYNTCINYSLNFIPGTVVCSIIKYLKHTACLIDGGTYRILSNLKKKGICIWSKILKGLHFNSKDYLNVHLKCLHA